MIPITGARRRWSRRRPGAVGRWRTGVLRASPEDFVVDEILGFAASGEGPHALLRVRKRGANTEWVARELARAAGCKPFEVGFAGLKDRNAVTTQAFTVPRGKRAAEEFVGLTGEGFEVLEAAAHQRKLPRGALEGNRFDDHGSRAGLRSPRSCAQRLAAIAGGGVPNYFGPQRFGRDGGNLGAGDAGRGGARAGRGVAAARPTRASCSRRRAASSSMPSWPSACRQGSWNRLLPGDVANLDGRGSVFAVEAPDAELERRCAALDMHPTAPLLGAGESLARGAVLELEAGDRGAVSRGAWP